MRSFRRYRERRKETAELNITAFMNLMVILVPFLLITAVFSRLAILELQLPSSEAPPEETEPEFQLEVMVRESAIEVGDRNAGLLNRIESTREGYDYEALGAYLQRVKAEFPDKADVTLLLEPDVSYQTLVEVMDAVRLYEVVDESTNGVTRAELFPNISIGDAPDPGLSARGN